MGIPDYDIPDAIVHAALSAARSGVGEALKQLLTDPDPNRAYLAAEKAQSQGLENWEADELLAVISGLSVYVDDFPDVAGLLFSARDRAIFWLGEMLSRVPDGADLATVSAALSQTRPATRFQALQRAQKRQESSDRPPSWIEALGAQYAREARRLVMQNLRRRDQADEMPVAYYINFATDNGDPEALKAAVQSLIHQGSVELEDVASRTVGIRRLVSPGAAWRLGDADQATWNRIAPDGTDPWYEVSPEQDVDTSDVSWVNRRRFVRGRLQPPGRA